MSANDIQNTTHRFSDAAGEPCVMLTPIEGFNKKPLVTLEEATEPLKNIVPCISTHAHTAKERAKNPADDLSVDESASIALYTMEWEPHTNSLYFILNSTLRNEDRNKLKPWFLYLKLIITALSRLPSLNLSIYRGVKGMVASEHEKYKIGSKLVWWGFSSCSAIRDISENDHFLGQTGARTLFVIDCIKGKNIQNHSRFKKENEILLLPATHVEVISYEQQPNNLHVIHLQEIESSDILLESVSAEKEIQDFKKMSIRKIKLRTLIMSSMIIGHYRNTKLKAYMQQCKSESEAHLNGRRLSNSEVEVVVQELIQEKKCRSLFLRDSHITSEGALIISEALRKNNTLEGLFLAHNQLGDDGTKYLAEALDGNKNSTIKQLSLCDNGITDKGIEYLARMLESNATLTHLWLASNKISDQGLELLSEVLINKNNTLQVLSLEWNKFHSATSITNLVGLLKINKSLTTLNLENCRLSASGVEQLKILARRKKNFELLIH
ncbi:unnamed protein product [Rotaria sordida]|uniref:NAD(P)(+)--arginine ADP-ribosyltransferase n=1 Tax=Rotaria sordida TaxID=392033 RepID=A0A814LSU2_9BILA|nr:unnamed protein product [Rotaria sordida]CAF1252702.1 unnamed protein product [Rotaria sordida]